MPDQDQTLKKLNLVKRREVSTAPDDLVRLKPLFPALGLPLKIEPAVEGVSLLDWAASAAGRVHELLRQHGGLLFRGFSIGGVAEFEELVRTLCGEDLMSYTYRSTPRSEVAGKVYTSTEYPADQHIPLHNEMSYTSEWPMRIAFFCAQAAESGGETPIADSRRVYERIDPAVRERFAARGVMYVRNYRPGLDIPWEEVFQSSDRSAVEGFCRQAGIETEWKPDGGLCTRQVCQGVARHPATGERVWFNQAHLFHISSLTPSVRRALLAERGEEELPRNAYYGDGSPIEDETLAAVREAYRSETVDIAWCHGDLVLLDNMLAAHGRAPFRGPRKILVAMAGPSSAHGAALREVGL